MRNPPRGPWTIAVAALFFAIALAGCTIPGGDGEPRYTLTIVDAPAQADVGEEVTFTWRIEGDETSTDHTAVHFSLASTADQDEVGLDDFDALTEVQTGDVPDTFEATFEMPFPGIVYFRAHTIIDGANYFSNEQTVQVEGTPMEVLESPAQVEAGSDFDVSWRFRYLGQVNTPHTAIHFDDESHDEDVRGGNPFAWDLGLRPQPPHSGQIPAEFTATIPANKPGHIYFVAHGIVGGVNWLSVEQAVEVVNPSEPNIVILDAPTEVVEGETFNITFQVNVPDDNTPVDHVGVEWDNASHGKDVSMYQQGGHKGPAELPLTAPNEFTVEMTAPDHSGNETMYYRGHARRAGNDSDVLSAEHTIQVRPRTDITVTDAPDCVVEEDDGTTTVEVTFDVSVPETQMSDHIGVHHDTESHAGDDATSGDYADAGPHEGGQLPGTFTRNFTVSQTGTHYFRAHALMADGTSLLSSEHSVSVESGIDACQ